MQHGVRKVNKKLVLRHHLALILIWVAVNIAIASQISDRYFATTSDWRRSEIGILYSLIVYLPSLPTSVIVEYLLVNMVDMLVGNGAARENPIALIFTVSVISGYLQWIIIVPFLLRTTIELVRCRPTARK